jgi:hypothetical protein
MDYIMSLVLQSSGGGSITIAEPATASNFTQTLPSASGTVMVSGNQPAFSAFASAGQALTGSVVTKLIFNSEEFDTANAFDSTTNYRFQPLVAGYYQFNAAFSTGAALAAAIYLYKNGSSFKTGNYNNASVVAVTVSALIFMNGSTDYVEAYGIVGANSTTGAGATNTYFQAAMVRSA